ncbi:LOW QUALITY PROTEIN: hypothetical protein ACHAXA_003816 [Cyclostephanos tholiformis]|uniref:Tafazzin family protein n=1 Tax=Cyclostephanos tholiformis TaxID=382380 RepID=A0ABD3RWL4_9STRA
MRSLFDDPGVISCLLPLPIAIQPRYNRWALCSQEYCFNDALPGMIRGYIGAGIADTTGGGYRSTSIAGFRDAFGEGGVVSRLPRGVWQWDELGGRRRLPHNAISVSSSDFVGGGGGGGDDADGDGRSGRGGGGGDGDVAREDDGDSIRIIPATARQRALPPSPMGKLKWGVGKLIAHAPITPMVIPFAHAGMERLLPQDEHTGKTRLRDDMMRSLFPRVLGGGGGDGNDKLRVRVRFGEGINFDDLIREHEIRYGKLWKYRCEDDLDDDDDEGGGADEEGGSLRLDENGRRRRIVSWKSSEEERVLYSKIVRRIEGRLDALTRQVCRETEEARR